MQWTYENILGNIRVENFPLNTIKGKICTQTLILEFNYKESVKPKAILLMFGKKSTYKDTQYSSRRCTNIFSAFLTLTAIITCTISAVRIGKHFRIQKYRRHLLNLKSHCVLTSIFIMCVKKPFLLTP